MTEIKPEDRANVASEPGLDVETKPNKYDPAIWVILGGRNVGSLVPRCDFASDCRNDTHTKRPSVDVSGLRGFSRRSGGLKS